MLVLWGKFIYHFEKWWIEAHLLSFQQNLLNQNVEQLAVWIEKNGLFFAFIEEKLRNARASFQIKLENKKTFTLTVQFRQ